MKWCSLAGCFVLAAAVAHSQGGAAEADLKSFQGDWVVTEHRPLGVPKVVYERVSVKGEVMTLHSALGDQRVAREYKFKLDGSAVPKRIDFSSGAAGDEPFRGLYQIKDGQVLLGFRPPGTSRPKDFKDESERGIVTIFLTLARPK